MDYAVGIEVIKRSNIHSHHPFQQDIDASCGFLLLLQFLPTIFHVVVALDRHNALQQYTVTMSNHEQHATLWMVLVFAWTGGHRHCHLRTWFDEPCRHKYFNAEKGSSKTLWPVLPQAPL